MEIKKFAHKKDPKFFKYDTIDEICSLKDECIFCDVYHNDKD